ncbi:MAG: FadR/GntR family transcriptional regulator [Desulfobacteraceae bacterium]|jgi:DNA-binding FadR family transcriptional regulator
MQDLFRKARQNRVFQDVVEQIQDAVLEGRLRPGDRLPAERELGTLFGVSRGTLREALRVLEQKGLIEIRLGVGGGAVVQDAGSGPLSESLILLMRSQKVSLEHLAEFREEVEGAVTALAARRADREDMKRLRDLLEQAGTYCEAGIAQWDEFVRTDERMHMTISQIARNPLYAIILQTIHDNIHRYYNRFLPVAPDIIKENYQDLSDIVAAVEAHDAERARRVAAEHVRRFYEHMAARRQGTLEDAFSRTTRAS